MNHDTGIQAGLRKEGASFHIVVADVESIATMRLTTNHNRLHKHKHFLPNLYNTKWPSSATSAFLLTLLSVCSMSATILKITIHSSATHTPIPGKQSTTTFPKSCKTPTTTIFDFHEHATTTFPQYAMCTTRDPITFARWSHGPSGHTTHRNQSRVTKRVDPCPLQLHLTESLYTTTTVPQPIICYKMHSPPPLCKPILPLAKHTTPILPQPINCVKSVVPSTFASRSDRGP